MTEFADRELDGSRNGSHGFAVTVDRDPEGVWIRVVGELDIATAPELDRTLEECAGVGPCRLLIDLGGVEFMTALAWRRSLAPSSQPIRTAIARCCAAARRRFSTSLSSLAYSIGYLRRLSRDGSG